MEMQVMDGRVQSRPQLYPLSYVHNTMSAMGIDFHGHKIRKQFSFRFKLFLGLIAFDLVEFTLVAVLTFLWPDYGMVIGDVGMVLMEPRFRNFMIVLSGCMRLQMISLLVNYLVDDHQWLVRVNEQFHELGFLRIDKLLLNSSRYCIRFLYSSFAFTSFVVIGLLFLRHLRVGFGWMHLPALVYTWFTLCAIIHVQMMFYLQYCLVIQLSYGFFKQAYKRVLLLGVTSDAKLLLIQSLETFQSSYYMLDQEVAIYLRPTYVIIVVCTMLTSMPCFNLIFNKSVDKVTKAVFVLLMFYCLSVIMIISYWTGKIDIEAKRIAREVYRRFSADRCLSKKLDFGERLKVKTFFECFQKQIFGLELFYNPINLGTTITIFTIYFTFISMFRQQINYLL